MPLIDKFSNIGEGRRRKELEQLAKLVNTWEPEIEDLGRLFGPKTSSSGSVGDREPPTTPSRGVRHHREARAPHVDSVLRLPAWGCALHRGSIGR